MAVELVDSTMKAAKVESYTTEGSFLGKELEYIETAHPFMNRGSLVIVGDHVTLESGTGCVHTAPGFGVEDFEVCKNYPQVGIVVPVDAKGRMTKEAGKYEGLSTSEANKVIAKDLEESGALFALEKIVHQYPHCWRCKDPIIFRATEQWFCSVKDLKIRRLKPSKTFSGFLNGERNVLKEWLLTEAIGVFHVKELGVFQFLLFTARNTGSLLLTKCNQSYI